MATTENQTQPPAAGLIASEPFVSAHGRALVVIALFVAYIVVASLSVLTTAFRFATDSVILTAVEETGEQLTLSDLIALLMGLGVLVVYVSLVIAFLLWLYRVSKNLPALGNVKSKIEYTPGWAVGWFFIPFANLVMPYKAVREVWEKSDPAIKSESDIMFTPPASAPLLLGWWISWIASNVLSNISWRLDGRSTLGTQGFVAGVDIISDVAGIISAVLAILVVKGIDRRQAERARHVVYVPHMPPPPPLFTPPPPPPPPTPQGT
jgi:Domain of unknown function (DUF4328)